MNRADQLTDMKCAIKACSNMVRRSQGSGRPRRYCDSCISTRCECGNEKGSISRSCMVCERKRRRRPMRTCQHCGDQFLPKASNRISFCSRKCSFQYKAEKKSRRRAQAVNNRDLKLQARKDELIKRDMQLDVTCKECGHGFRARIRTIELYCSDACRQKARRSMRKKTYRGPRSERAKMARRRCKAARRARLANAPRGERVCPASIFERDKWLCGICGTITDRNAKVPSPLAATLDHIIPLAKGGSHDPSNVQCAHFICNSRKSDKVDVAA